ncbi:MAG: hypothetical protein QXN55_07505 [Candidatus Nitrosotenuis sp.]
MQTRRQFATELQLSGVYHMVKQQYVTVELEDIQNTPRLELKEDNSIQQQKIKERRKIVHDYHIRGYFDQGIAEKLGYSLSTIEHDLHQIRRSARKWYEEEIITEYCTSLHDSVVLYDFALADLKILYREADEIGSKLEILRTMADFSQKRAQFYEKTSIIRRYLQGLAIKFMAGIVFDIRTIGILSFHGFSQHDVYEKTSMTQGYLEGEIVTNFVGGN